MITVARTRTAIVALMLGLAIGTLTACSSSSAPSSQLQASHRKAGLALPDVNVGHPYVFGLGGVCGKGKLPITVKSITPETPTGGMRVTGWAVQTSQPGVSTPGDLEGSLASFGLHRNPVSVACGGTTTSNVFISVEASTRTQEARAFYVNYGAGQKTLMLYTLAVCPHKCPDLRPLVS